MPVLVGEERSCRSGQVELSLQRQVGAGSDLGQPLRVPAVVGAGVGLRLRPRNEPRCRHACADHEDADRPPPEEAGPADGACRMALTVSLDAHNWYQSPGVEESAA